MPLFRRGSSGGGSLEQDPVPTAAAASPPPEPQQQPPQAQQQQQPASTTLRTPPQPASLASTVTPAAPVPLTVPLGAADTHILRFQSWVYDEQARARRFLVLEGRTLAFYPDEDNTSPMVGQENVERLPLGGDAVLDFVAGASAAASHSPARMVFCVRAGGERFVFSCERAADESEWIEHIQETIEAMKRHSEHAELAGLLLNNPSANGTVLSTTTTAGAAAERGTPVSEQRLAISAPSLSPSERASCRTGAVPAPSTPTPMQQQLLLQDQLQQAGSPGKAVSTSAPATAPDDDERLLAAASSLEEPVTPAISGREELEGTHPPHAPHPSTAAALPLATPPSGAVWPASAPSSTLPTPWGEAADDPTAAIAAPGVPSGSPGKEGMAPALAVTFAGAMAQQQQQPAVLTTSALQELGGLRKGPSADREDAISLEERKQRVVEGMRRSSRAASEALAVVAAAAAAAGTAVATTASGDSAPAQGQATGAAGGAAPPGGEAAESERDVYVFQGWVKMSRRRWYMLLNAGKGGKVGRRLDFYGSLADLEARRPPKETILLTSGCIVESRRLPLPPSNKGLGSMVTAAAPASSGGHNASSSTAYSSGATPTTASSFSDTLEPDSVIDLLIPTNSGSKGLRTLTLQTFTVEEENRWISELQLAIGALTEADDEELFGAARESGAGMLFSRTRELSGPLAAPQACCTIS